MGVPFGSLAELPDGTAVGETQGVVFMQSAGEPPALLGIPDCNRERCNIAQVRIERVPSEPKPFEQIHKRCHPITTCFVNVVKTRLSKIASSKGDFLR